MSCSVVRRCVMMCCPLRLCYVMLFFSFVACSLQSAIKLLFHFDANTKDSSAASDSSSAYGEHLSAEIGKFDLPNTHLVFFLLYYFIITCFCFGEAVGNGFWIPQGSGCSQCVCERRLESYSLLLRW